MKTLILLIIAILLVLLSSGCNPKVEPRVSLDYNMTISSNDARFQLSRGSENAAIIVADSNYVLPSKEWIEWCSASYWRMYRGTFLLRWMPRWDCDNRARHFELYLQEKAAQQLNAPKGIEGVAVFVRFFKQNLITGHAINVFLLDDFLHHDYEPQKQNG